MLHKHACTHIYKLIPSIHLHAHYTHAHMCIHRYMYTQTDAVSQQQLYVDSGTIMG